MEYKADALREITDKLTDLPTLPTVVTTITQLMQNPRTSASEVGQAITTDQSLASKTLKLVNSAFYGFPGRINTITHAIVILGFTTVKNIVLTASILRVMGKSKDDGNFDPEAFWLHSISTGAVAKVLAEHLKFKYTEEAFIGGLLHDLGKVVINQCANEDFQNILDYRLSHNCLMIEAEKEVLKVTHDLIGGWVAEKWNLPKELISIMQYHHHPHLAGPYQQITNIIHIADIIARGLGSGNGGDNRMPIVDDGVWSSMKMDRLDLHKLLRDSKDEILRAGIFMQAI